VKIVALVIPVCLALAGCMSAARHQQELGSTNDRALTVGSVQQQIKVGVAQSDVAMTLGAPNIVTRDRQDRETWVYDKIATEASFSQDTGSVFAAVMGHGAFSASGGDSGDVTANAGGNYSRQAGAASLTQRTLTVVIKFDRSNTVESLSYHSTTF
jgi:outer membrane protein assembly factor BamE (lipoprotein component of BamABCDE complex)